MARGLAPGAARSQTGLARPLTWVGLVCWGNSSAHACAARRSTFIVEPWTSRGAARRGSDRTRSARLPCCGRRMRPARSAWSRAWMRSRRCSEPCPWVVNSCSSGRASSHRLGAASGISMPCPRAKPRAKRRSSRRPLRRPMRRRALDDLPCESSRAACRAFRAHVASAHCARRWRPRAVRARTLGAPVDDSARGFHGEAAVPPLAPECVAEHRRAVAAIDFQVDRSDHPRSEHHCERGRMLPIFRHVDRDELLRVCSRERSECAAGSARSLRRFGRPRHPRHRARGRGEAAASRCGARMESRLECTPADLRCPERGKCAGLRSSTGERSSAHVAIPTSFWHERIARRDLEAGDEFTGSSPRSVL